MAKEVYLSANCKSTAGGNFPGAGTQGGKTGKVKTAFHRNAVSGDPGGIRTHDPPLRRRLLYPAELLSHNVGRGSRTRTGDPLLPKQVRYQLRYAPWHLDILLQFISFVKDILVKIFVAAGSKSGKYGVVSDQWLYIKVNS